MEFHVFVSVNWTKSLRNIILIPGMKIRSKIIPFSLYVFTAMFYRYFLVLEIKLKLNDDSKIRGKVESFQMF